ncbi:MAG TPA: hypothetical protein VHB21_27840, partial [Minicystis sp.]|nr:hypothetical protein [Minicystis sp.]
MHRAHAFAQLAAALALLVTGCAASSDVHGVPRAGQRDAPADVAPNVVVVQRTPGVDVDVEPDRLVVASAGADDVRAAHPGDVLVSGFGAGFLRRVVHLEDEGASLVVFTQPATIT